VSDAIIEPGATLGMLGGGQLGRMFIDAAHALGYRVHVLSPDADGPAAQVADIHTAADYGDLAAVERFAASVAAVTYEFENVPAACAAACAAHAPVRPGQRVLAVAQDRVREKTTLRDLGVPVGRFAAVGSLDELTAAVADLGCPAVLKTAGGGYDGKGQRVLRSEADVTYAWEDLGRVPCILEAFVDFEQEVSVVAARGAEGETVCYGPIANTHRNHILDVSVVPSGASKEVEDAAVAITRAVMAGLGVVGVLCVEFFQLRSDGPLHVGGGGRMLVNELAPRPHNSGHLTIDAYGVSQFEQQVRTVCGGSASSNSKCGPFAGVLPRRHRRGAPRRWRTCWVTCGRRGREANRLGARWAHTPPTLTCAFTFTARPMRGPAARWVISQRGPVRHTRRFATRSRRGRGWRPSRGWRRTEADPGFRGGAVPVTVRRVSRCRLPGDRRAA